MALTSYIFCCEIESFSFDCVPLLVIKMIKPSYEHTLPIRRKVKIGLAEKRKEACCWVCRCNQTFKLRVHEEIVGIGIGRGLWQTGVVGASV